MGRLFLKAAAVVLVSHKKIGFLKLKVMFLAFISLMGGFLVYAFFRNNDVLAYKIIEKPIFLNGLNRTFSQEIWLFHFFVYSLPDGLWLLSGILFIRALWLGNTKTGNIYILVICVCALVLETCQMFHLLSGTFDILDICAMVLAVFGEGMFNKYYFSRRIRYA
jgi:hypothetical protein